MNIAKKIYNLLTPTEKICSVKLFGLMVVGMVLEMLGVGLIIPVLTILTQENASIKYSFLQYPLHLIGNPSHAHVVIIGMAVLVILYIIKSLFLVYLAFRQTEFAFSVQVRLAHHLFTLYLRQPYVYHFERNSAQLIRCVVEEVKLFTHTVMHPGIVMLSEVFVLLGLSGLMLVVQPLGALVVVLVMGVAAFTFYRSSRIRISRWAEARQYHEGQEFLYLHEGLGAVKDIKLLGLEEYFLGRYLFHSVKSAEAGRLQSSLQQIPRLFFELLAVVGMALLAVVMIMHGEEITTVVPTLGLFAIAAFRLMPSVTRVLGAIHSVRYGIPVINKLDEELRLSIPNAGVPNSNWMNFQHEITLNGVNFSYPGTSVSVIKNLSIVIQKGLTIGFVGPSGSGKSTLIDIILGLLTPDTGQVIVDGQEIQSNLRQWQNQLGYVPQSIYLTDDTLRHNIAFGIADNHISDVAIQRAISAAQLEDFVNSLPDGVETIVGERGVRLSGGQRQRIGIARALYLDPSVLVLDEATAALDTNTELEITRALTALHGSKTILIIAHRISTLKGCDVIYQIEKGRIVSFGSYDELVETNKKNINVVKEQQDD